MFNNGFHWTLHCRTATDEECGDLECNRTDDEIEAELRAAGLTAARALETEAKEAPFEQEMTPPAEGNEKITEEDTIDGWGEWWLIEPERTQGRRVMRVHYRGGDGDMWVDGNFGMQCATGRALPWTAEREAVLRAAGPYWSAL